MVELFKALADENRLRILSILMSYELCVCELEVVLQLNQSNVSRHLSKLKSIKLITSSKDAQWIHYKSNEAFNAENELLISYLKLNFNNRDLFLRDKRRCDIYKNSGYNCQTITNDKNLVLRYIENTLQ